MNEKIIDVIETTLLTLKIKEHFAKEKKTYVITKEELIDFCRELIKVIKDIETDEKVI
jgi:hypothetical protein